MRYKYKVTVYLSYYRIKIILFLLILKVNSLIKILLDKAINLFSVIVFDNRGIGSTTIGSKNFTIDEFAVDSAGLLDSIEISKSDIRIFYGRNDCSAINIDIADASNQKTKSIVTRIEPYLNPVIVSIYISANKIHHNTDQHHGIEYGCILHTI